MISVANLWRHPIKSHGREALEIIMLSEGQTIPWDRHWAVAHDKTKFDAADPAWVMCRNFVIGALTPEVAGIWAQFDEDAGLMTLTHTRLGEVTFRPDDPVDATRFLNWVAPLTNTVSFKPVSLVSLGARGMTDTDYPSVSIMSHATNNAVAAIAGKPLEAERWRGNIWLDGTAPWEEFEWFGRDLRIGNAVLHVREPVKRCRHPAVNPQTGQRDTDVINILNNSFGHQNFGIYAEVIQSGHIALGDTAEVL